MQGDPTRSDALKVAWVTPYPPDRNGGGGHIREAHLLLATAEHAEVTLITGGVVKDPAVRGAVAGLVEVAPPRRNFLERGRLTRRAGDLWGATASRTAREARALAPLRSAMVAPLAGCDAEVVVVEYTGLAPIIDEEDLGGLRSRSRWVVTAVNLPSRMAAHQAAIMPKRRQRWLFRREAATAARFEADVLGRYDQVVAVSEADRDFLGMAGTAVVANGVDLKRFSPSALPGSARIVFTGALYTTPNTDAALWLCEEILPEVRRAVPNATLDVVGAAPPPEVRALRALKGVEVHGNVADVRPFLAGAAVVVVPIRIGSGTRLKALEAWASARPVVGTTLGMEGLGATPGVEALIADDAGAFAGAVVSVLRDPALASRLAESGLALATGRHGWQAAQSQWLRAILYPPPHEPQGKRGR